MASWIIDGNGGIHIAAFDPTFGDLKYAYLPTYNTSYNEETMSYTVDSSGNTGSHLILDVGIDSDNNNKLVPYIAYWGGSMPKLAYKVSVAAKDGTSSDMFTGDWEAGYIPTSSSIRDLDQKRLSNLDNRINVGLWKDADGNIITSSNTNSDANSENGRCYGNGTKYPVLGYSIIATDKVNDRIETAQMQ